MTGIHGAVYLIGGIVLSIVSFMLNGNNWKGNFILFFFLGVIGVVVGLIKLIPKHKEKHNVHQHHQVHHNQTGFTGYCNSCGTALGHLQQFCHKCGVKIFHK